MDPVIASIREELAVQGNEEAKKSFQRFFKNEVRCYGIKTGIVVKLAKEHWKTVRTKDKYRIFELCEELYRSGYCEEAFIVSTWVPNLNGQYDPGDLDIFRGWIETYITNWATCDGFCNHSVGSLIERFPEKMGDLYQWAESENLWLRRASAVSLIVPAKKGRFLEESFRIADILHADPEDMVQKGYGWLLKEASRLHQDEVFDYVMQNRRTMPRTALRYAIELMPREMRAEAMKKDW